MCVCVCEGGGGVGCRSLMMDDWSTGQVHVVSACLSSPLSSSSSSSSLSLTYYLSSQSCNCLLVVLAVHRHRIRRRRHRIVEISRLGIVNKKDRFVFLFLVPSLFSLSSYAHCGEKKKKKIERKRRHWITTENDVILSQWRQQVNKTNKTTTREVSRR